MKLNDRNATTLMLALFALLSALVATALYRTWVPSAAESVQDYLRYLGDLDHTLHYLKQFEPAYPLWAAAPSAMGHMSLLFAITVSRIILTFLTFYLVGRIVVKETESKWMAFAAMAFILSSAGFWSLSINLLRNYFALVLTLGFLWILAKAFQREERSSMLLVSLAMLLAAIFQSHIVMGIIVTGTLVLFLLLWVLRLVTRQVLAHEWQRFRDLFLMCVGAVGLAIPYLYIRFFSQKLYLIHDYVLPQAAPQKAAAVLTPTLIRWPMVFVDFIYRLVVDFSPTSLTHFFYWLALVAGVSLIITGFRRGKLFHLFLGSMTIFNFFAMRNDVFGIRLLPDRLGLVFFLPGILSVCLWLGTTLQPRWVAKKTALLITFILLFLHILHNASTIVLQTHIGERSPEEYAQSKGQTIFPETLLAVVPPDELREGRYTGPTTIPGFEGSIVTKTPETVQLLETTDPFEAWQLARAHSVRYVYMNSLYNSTYHQLLERTVNVSEEKFLDQRFFIPVFSGITELSQVRLYQIRETPSMVQTKTPASVRSVKTMYLTASQDVAAIQHDFDRSAIVEWSTDFEISNQAVTSLQEYIQTKDGQYYRLANENGLVASVTSGTFWNTVTIHRPQTPLDRWRVANVVKGTIDTGTLFEPMGRSLQKDIALRIETKGFALYGRFAVTNLDDADIVVPYMTPVQFEKAFGAALFILMLVAVGLVSVVLRVRLKKETQ